MDGVIMHKITNYKKEFWNGMMKGIKGNYEDLKGGNIGNEMYVLPYDSNKKYRVYFITLSGRK